MKNSRKIPEEAIKKQEDWEFYKDENDNKPEHES